MHTMAVAACLVLLLGLVLPSPAATAVAAPGMDAAVRKPRRHGRRAHFKKKPEDGVSRRRTSSLAQHPPSERLPPTMRPDTNNTESAEERRNRLSNRSAAVKFNKNYLEQGSRVAYPWAPTPPEQARYAVACAKVRALGDDDPHGGWRPGCRSGPDFWLWKADLRSKHAHVGKAFRTIRPGKTWKATFEDVDENTTTRGKAFLKLAGSSWVSADAATITHWQRVGWSANMTGTPAAAGSAGSAGGVFLPPAAMGPTTSRNGTRLRFDYGACTVNHSVPFRSRPIKWAGFAGSVLSESLAYHVSKVLGLYSVPPGKIVLLTPEVLGLHWGREHLCATDEGFAAYAALLAQTVTKPVMLGWLQAAAPRMQKTEAVGLHGCMGLCTWKPGENASSMDCTATSNRNRDCCASRNEWTRGETQIIQKLMGECDTKVNCFAADYGLGYQHIDVDNDCIGKVSENSRGSTPNCAFTPLALREHFVAQMDAVRKQYSRHPHPLLAAVRASQAEAVLRSAADVLGSTAEAAQFLDAQIKWKSNRQWGTPQWWANSISGKKSGVDAAANMLYELFTDARCISVTKTP